VEVSKDSSINGAIAVEFSLHRPFILQTWNEQLKRFVNVLSTGDLADLSQLHVVTFAASIPVNRVNDCLSVSLNMPKTSVTSGVLNVESAAAIDTAKSRSKAGKLGSESFDCYVGTESEAVFMTSELMCSRCFKIV
jgi:hypothetical protein